MDAGNDSQVMQCMEIWGGNHQITRRVSMAGLDVHVFSRPFASGEEARGVGGDIHYLSSCATGRISRMIVADVSGHGAAVGAVTASLRRLMGKYANYIDQSRFVAAVNQQFHALQAEADGLSALFATAVVATFFSPTDELSICNAGHPRPIRFDADRDCWEPILLENGQPDRDGEGPSNLPLGVLESARYDLRTIRLGPRDLVLVHTDPLLEVRNPAGDLLGQEGLLGILGETDPSRPEAFTDDLLQRLVRFATGTEHGRGFEFDDDVTILLLHRNGAKPTPSPLLGVRATGRLLARAVRSVLQGDLPLSLPQFRVDSLFGAMFARANRTRPRG